MPKLKARKFIRILRKQGKLFPNFIHHDLITHTSHQAPFPSYLVSPFKMESSCKTCDMKMSLICIKRTYRQDTFSYEWFCAKTHLTQRQKANRKWPIPFITICLGLPGLMSNSFSWRLASRCKDIGKETSTELVKISQSKNLVLPHPTFPRTRCSCKILH